MDYWGLIQYSIKGQNVSAVWLYLMAALGIAAGLAVLVLLRKKKIKCAGITACALACCLLFALLGCLGVRQLSSLRGQYDDVIDIKADRILRDMSSCLNSLESFDGEAPLESALYIIETASTLEGQWKLLSYEFHNNSNIVTPERCAHSLSQAFGNLRHAAEEGVLNDFENVEELKEYFAGAAQMLSKIVDFMSSCAAGEKGYVVGYDEWTFSSFSEMCSEMGNCQGGPSVMDMWNVYMFEEEYTRWWPGT